MQRFDLPGGTTEKAAWDYISTRPGDVVIEVWFTIHTVPKEACLGFLSIPGKPSLILRSLRLSEFELQELMGAYWHVKGSGANEKIVFGSVDTRASQLWKTGMDSIWTRQLAPLMIAKWKSSQMVAWKMIPRGWKKNWTDHFDGTASPIGGSESCWPCIYFHPNHELTSWPVGRMRRLGISDATKIVTQQPSSGLTNSSEIGKKSTDGQPDTTLQPTPSSGQTQMEASSAENGEKVPEADPPSAVCGAVCCVGGDDTEVRFGEQHIGEFPLVVGKVQCDLDPHQYVGAVVLPIAQEPFVYNSCKSNLIKGKTKRIDEKPSHCELKEADLDDLRSLMMEIIKTTFKQEDVRAWMVKNADPLSWKSHKWSDKRFQESYEDLIQRVKPRHDHKTQVKVENLPLDKAPRLIISDQDKGQLLSLCVIKCIEDLLKKRYRRRNIKGRPKEEAIDDFCKELRQKNVCMFIEGDGSAWDTCCTLMLRNATENILLFHVCEQMVSDRFLDEDWAAAVEWVATKKKVKAKFNNKFGEAFLLQINSIRRSGDRGTSCLNWLINFVCWSASLLKNPKEAADPTRHRFTDKWGKKRDIRMCFEGDDSGLTVSPPLSKTECEEVEATWYRYGHNMKLEYGASSGLFVGVRLAIDKYGPILTPEKKGVWVPEIDRALLRGGVSCSASVKDALISKSDVKLKSLASSTALSRAYSFAGKVPTLSRKYLRYAEAMGRDHVYHQADLHEMKMKTIGAEDDNFTIGRVWEEIEMKNSCFHENESEILQACGYPASEDELRKFDQYEWDLSKLEDVAGFRESLPASWRGKK